MKTVLPLLLLGACVAAGCAGTSTYSTVVQIAPAQDPGQYLVWAIVKEDRSAWYYRHVLPAMRSPVLTCKPGELASAPLDAAARDTGLFIQAYFARQGDEKNTTCSVRLMRNGSVLTSTEVMIAPTPVTPSSASSAGRISPQAVPESSPRP